MTLSLDLDWITENLAVGGSFPAAHAAHLAESLGIRHVVDLREEACDDETRLSQNGIELLHLPTPDVCAIDESRIREGVAWVNARLDRGSRVLIHCEHGIGRSALLALCILVARGEPPLEALRRTKHARKIVAPSPEQLTAFSQYCSSWREGRDPSWEIPSFDELADIAYRHLSGSFPWGIGWK
jgi:predicted protein tyrosine phosphatase